ncbi:MAG: sigma-70 family RNA polymerase sigma factor, partial [Planctomycetes bacterium]|nr:sigma-70 family RNA polymerase sigma factor [Planctomycetota bacterium]
MTPRHRIADELAANADALRALAIDLVGRGDAADLVQDTAVRALRSPPAEPHALGAWLATVLRNLASNHRRGDARRRRREHAAPSIGDVAPADVELERREVLRTVTDALWCLPEPYQSALVWRYFENLTPSAIAAQKGLPLATVKSRLQRGLQAMRTELDRRDRGRWRAIVPFAFGSEARPPIAAATAAALIMTPTAKVLSIAAAAAAVVLVLLLLRAGEPTPPASGDRIARAAPAAGGVYREPAIADPTGVARTSVASVDASPAVDLSHPYEFALRCRVVDRDGLPVVGAKLGFNLRDHTPNLWPTPTDRDGSVELRWRGRVERLTMAIGLLMHGRGLALREVSVRAGASQQIELLADFGGAGDGPCEAGSRRPEVACRRCHQGPVLPEVFTPRLDLLTRLHPETSLADRLAAVIVADADAVPPSPPEEEEVSLSDI